MNATFEKEYIVDSRDVDLFGTLRPSTMLANLQDAATVHGFLQGMGREVLVARYNAFWMMARLSFHLDRPIRFGETLNVCTYHRGSGGAMVYRDFDLTVDGQPVGECTTAWVVTTFDTRTMLRPKRIPELVNAEYPSVTKSKTLGHLKPPGELQLLELRPVRYSETDINGHMNNTRYADVACDAIGYEKMKDRFLSDMQINYLKECFAGETLHVLGVPTEAGWFIRGADDAGSAHVDMTLGFTDR